MKILSFGAGMQSTALALMSCENAFAKTDGKELPYPLVPIYDIVIFCDLGLEPVWVRKQADFVRRACETAGIRYKELDAPLYQDLMRDFGKKRVVSIPWWTIDEKGHKSKFPRNCTLDYKVQVISKYVRWELLGYRKHQRLRDEDKKAHEMHLGFSFEEKKRCKESPNPMFVNKFPLVDMMLERKDNYAYIKDVWGLDTKASACCFCPFHRNYFFEHLKHNEPSTMGNCSLWIHCLRRIHPNRRLNRNCISHGAGNDYRSLLLRTVMMRNAFCITAIRYGMVFKGGASDGQDRHCCRKRYGAERLRHSPIPD